MSLAEGVRTLRLLRAARATTRWSAERVRARQCQQLRALLHHAYERVPLYRELYGEAGFHPAMFRSLDDLEAIPRLSKARLKQARPLDVVARGTDLRACELVRTSGSTGVPLQVWLGPRDRSWHRAVAWRILFEHGFRWTYRTLEIRIALGPTFRLQRFGVAPKRWLSVLDPPASWVDHLIAGRHEVVVASPSTLQVLAEAVESRGVRITPPRLIVSDSETLTAQTRRLITRALGTNPIDVFGLVELSNFAWQCEHRSRFHVSADSHIAEVATPRGTVGDLIVTGLGMWTTPIIRYETGDLAEVGPDTCGCGRTLPTLARVHGRVADAVVLPDGRRLLWPFFHETLAAFTALERWQVVQHAPHRIDVRVAMRRHDDGVTRAVHAALTRVLPAGVDLRVEHVPSLATPPGEKPRAVVSRVSSAALAGAAP